jgi:hypothetical protein
VDLFLLVLLLSFFFIYNMKEKHTFKVEYGGESYIVTFYQGKYLGLDHNPLNGENDFYYAYEFKIRKLTYWWKFFKLSRFKTVYDSKINKSIDGKKITVEATDKSMLFSKLKSVLKYYVDWREKRAKMNSIINI